LATAHLRRNIRIGETSGTDLNMLKLES
jgi:hypothetical protein